MSIRESIKSVKQRGTLSGLLLVCVLAMYTATLVQNVYQSLFLGNKVSKLTLKIIMNLVISDETVAEGSRACNYEKQGIQVFIIRSAFYNHVNFFN